MKKKKSYVISFYLLLSLLLAASFTVSNSVLASITGSSPPASGDWVINSPTTVINENLTIDGNIIVNSSLKVIDSVIWFKSNKSVLNVTERGSLYLKNVTIKGYNDSVRWVFSIYNGGTCEVDNTTLINVGYEGAEYQTGVWINSDSVVINNTVIINPYVGIWISGTRNITINNTKIYSDLPTSYMGLRVLSSNGIVINNLTIEATKFINAIRIEHAENVTINNSFLNISTANYVVFLLGSKGVFFYNSEIINYFESGGFGFYAYSSDSIKIVNTTLQSRTHALNIYGGVSNLLVKGSDIISSNGDAVYVRGSDNGNITIDSNRISAKIVVFDYQNAENITIRNNSITSSVTRYGSFSHLRNISLINNTVLDAYYGLLIDDSRNLTFIDEKINVEYLLFDIWDSENISIRTGMYQAKDFLYAINSKNISLIENEINAYEYALDVENSVNLSVISNKIVTPTGTGLIIKNVYRSQIENNYVLSNKAIGIQSNSRNITLEDNEFYSNKSNYMENVTYIKAYNNEFLANQTALALYNVTYSWFYYNKFTSNTSYGLLLGRNSSYNRIVGNEFYESKLYGLYIHNGTGNLIFFNLFLFNNNNGTQALDEDTGNNWNYTNLGNWYFNYDAPDFDGDGIGDEPVQVGPNAIDYYPLMQDQDKDSVNDLTEVMLYGTNPNTNDTDKDGLTDGEEIYKYGTDPLSNDTDKDGLLDGWEQNNDLNPKDPNDATKDPDEDGLTNQEEYHYGTNPQNNDTDGDGMPDGWEVQHGLNATKDDAGLDPDEDGLTNLQEYQHRTDPQNNDTDGDGMPDGWEVQHGLDPLSNDASDDLDNDGLTNLEEYQNGTDPRNNDTDGDGMPDGWEVQHGLNATKDDAELDADEDGLTNLEEYQHATDPQNNDTDGDGLTDYEEVETYHTNPLKADTDGDGLADGEEVNQGLNPLSADTDGDGIIDSQDSLPKLNNNILYGVIIAVIALVGVLVYYLKFRR